MMTHLVDSHCHLNYPGLVEDHDGVLARAAAAGVGAMLNISTRQSEWPTVIAQAEASTQTPNGPAIWASIGIHPHDADHHPAMDVATLVQQAAHPRVVGIGETGLDYYYDKSDRAQQQRCFVSHLDAARETGLPVIVHTRDAETDTIRLLRDAADAGPVTGVIHCFTASQQLADAALALGFYISLSGIVTFKNARDLQDTAKTIPLERLLIETDAPFLAPVPHRGKSCEPAYVADTAQFLAALRGEEVATLAAKTRDNFYKLFHKAAA